MNKFMLVQLCVWGGASIVLYGLCVFYLKKTFQSLKVKSYFLSAGFLSVLLVSFWALQQRYGFGLTTLTHVFLIFNLSILAFHDWEEKQLPLEWLVFCFVFGVLFLWLNPERQLLETLLSTLLFAGGILLVCKVTRGAIGIGDALVIGLINLILGWEVAMIVFFLSLVGVGCLGIFLLLLKKVHKKTTIPFVPFILLAVLILVWL